MSPFQRLTFLPPRLMRWVRARSREEGRSPEQVLSSIVEAAIVAESQPSLFRSTAPPPSLESSGVPFTFVDLFAGIGGLRLGLERAGGRSRFSSEWDKYAQRTYQSWYGELPQGDIRKIAPRCIPDHDVLAAGFPCQPFSIAGVSKKNSLGRPHGFRDATQGTLFFHLAQIIEIKRPPVLLLENVKNLQSHDKGRTWEVIRSTLEGLGYRVFSKVLDAAGWVPQHRERIFIVGFNRQVFGEQIPFSFPQPPAKRPTLRDLLEPAPDPRYTLSDHLWKYLRDYAEKHRQKGNGFGFGLPDLNGITRTLSARYYKDGSEILIRRDHGNPRRLTPRECARLMGFPDELPIVVSDTQAYKQFGNAVVPLVAEAISRQVVAAIAWKVEQQGGLHLLRARAAKAAQGS